MQRVLQILSDFEKRSDLAVSLQKSSFFASGLSEQEISTIQASTGMPCGTLPMRYLGVPFTTKKLNQRSGWLRNKGPPLVEPVLHFEASLAVVLPAKLGLGPLLKKKIGNGEDTHFWYDNWAPFGQLYTFLNAASSRLGIPKTASVASLYRNGRWLLPSARTDNQLALQIYLRGPKPVVPWAKIVWFSYGIPRHSFLTWLVLLDRCPTKDRLLSWGLIVDAGCLLCNANPESRNHLYFECPFSAEILRFIAGRCDFQIAYSWNDIITQLQQSRRGRDSQRLLLLATQASIYWIWNERNSRLHRQLFKPPQTLISSIDKQLRNRLQSIRQRNPRASSAMMQLWLLHA